MQYNIFNLPFVDCLVCERSPREIPTSRVSWNGVICFSFTWAKLSFHIPFNFFCCFLFAFYHCLPFLFRKTKKSEKQRSKTNISSIMYHRSTVLVFSNYNGCFNFSVYRDKKWRETLQQKVNFRGSGRRLMGREMSCEYSELLLTNKRTRKNPQIFYNP